MRRMLTLGCVAVAWFAVSRAEDAYLLSDRSQAIDTLCCFNGGTTRVEVDAAIIGDQKDGEPFKMTSDDFLIGCNNLAGELYCTIHASANSKFGCVCNDNAANWKSSNCPVDELRHTFVLDGFHDKFEIKTDGVTVSTATALGTHTKLSQSLALFGRHTRPNGSVTSDFDCKARMKFYGLKFFERDVLTHDFVPAKKGGDYGIYDKITGQFRGPACGSPFQAFGDVLEIEDDPYVETPGYQGINTRHKMTSQTTIAVDFALNEAPLQARIFGNDGTGYDTCEPFYVSNSQLFSFGANVSGQTFVSYPLATGADTRRHVAVLNRGANTVHFINAGYTNETKTALPVGTTSGTSKYPILLAASPCAATGVLSSNAAKMRIYGAKIWEGDELIHDYVPCVKGDLAGLRDRVDGAFVTIESTNQVGVLSYGGKVRAIPDDPYLLSTGSEYFDTGFCPKGDTRVEMDFSLVNPRLTVTSGNGDQMLFGNAGTLADCLMFCGFANIKGYGWCCYNGKSDWSDSKMAATIARRTMIMDGKASELDLVTQNYTNFTSALSCPHAGAVSVYTMPILCYKNATGCPMSKSVAKLYSFKIWDDGTLIHSYVPRQDENGVYLKDLAEGGTDLRPMGTDKLTLGGSLDGLDPVFAVQPQGGGDICTGESQVLTASAPGADGYQWYCNGEPIPGATNPELTVSWKRHGGDEIYCVGAIFGAVGKRQEHFSAEVPFTHVPAGLLILFR